MKELASKVLVICMLFFLIQCTNSDTLTKKDYIEWVTSYENGLHTQKEIGELMIDLQHEPIDYLALKTFNGKVDTAAFATVKKDMGNLLFCQLKISLKDTNYDILTWKTTSQQEYINKVQYFSFGFQNDIYLEIPNTDRKIPCVMLHLEGLAEGKKTKTFMLGFDMVSSPTFLDYTLVIHSPALYTGTVKMKIKNNKVIPHLILD